MIVHAYFTDGFYDWACFYLETLRYYNGATYPVVFDTVGLTNKKMDMLGVLYPNLTIRNKPLDLTEYSRRANIRTDKIAAYKRECERQYVTPTNKVWKLMTAGDDRVKCLNNILGRYLLEDFYLLHTDIDTYFRGPLSPMIRKISSNDISMRIKPKVNPIKARMSIGVMGMRINAGVLDFMTDWVKEIDKLPPQVRPKGYGQISCWGAYKRNRGLKWGELPKAYGEHGLTKSNGKLWSGNIHNMFKTDVLDMFKADFAKSKKREGMA